MNRLLILLLIDLSFCVLVANHALADSANDDFHTQKVLKIHNELLNVLKSDISKEEKCKVIYGQLHSNTQDLFITMGRLMHAIDNSNELIQRYDSMKQLDNVAEELWPQIKAIANNKRSKVENFKYFCLQIKEDAGNVYLLNKGLEYVSTDFLDKNRLVMKTQLNGSFVYLTWVNEGRQWKLYNSTQIPPVNGGLSAKDKQNVEEIVTKTLLIEKYNTQCYRINKIFLDQHDANIFLKYKYGNTADIPQKEIVNAANKDTDAHVKEIINVFDRYDDCSKVKMKQAIFTVSKIMAEGMLNTMKNTVFASPN